MRARQSPGPSMPCSSRRPASSSASCGTSPGTRRSAATRSGRRRTSRIYLGGVVAGLTCGWLALAHDVCRARPRSARAAVRFWGFRAPFGAWVCIWGAFAMLTSAPFDDWWHNAYGLDVKILSPPHIAARRRHRRHPVRRDADGAGLAEPRRRPRQQLAAGCICLRGGLLVLLACHGRHRVHAAVGHAPVALLSGQRAACSRSFSSAPRARRSRAGRRRSLRCGLHRP